MPKAKPPFFGTIKVDYSNKSARDQAIEILGHAQDIIFNSDRAPAFVGITYSANQTQTEAIQSGDTDKMNASLEGGVNQAAVIREIIKLLNTERVIEGGEVKTDGYSHLFDHFAILPISTMQQNGGNVSDEQINNDLNYIHDFAAENGYILGWQNQGTENTDQLIAVGGGVKGGFVGSEQDKYIQNYFQELKNASEAELEAGQETVDLPEVKAPAAKQKNPAPNTDKSKLALAKHVQLRLHDGTYNEERIEHLINSAQKLLAEQKTAQLHDLVDHCQRYQAQLQACIDIFKNSQGDTRKRAQELLAKITPLTNELMDANEKKQVAHFSDGAEVVEMKEAQEALAKLCPGSEFKPDDGAYLLLKGKANLLKASDPFPEKARVLADKVKNGYSAAVQRYTSADTLRMDLISAPEKGRKIKASYQPISEDDPFGRSIPSDEILIDAMKKARALLAAAPANSDYSPIKMMGKISPCYAKALMLCFDALNRKCEPQTERLKKIKIHDDQRSFFAERIRVIVDKSSENRTLFTKTPPVIQFKPDEPEQCQPAAKAPPASRSDDDQPKKRQRAQSLNADQKHKQEDENNRPGPGRGRSTSF